MGSWISNQGGMSEEERKRRQNLEELLHKMKYSLNVTASTHYLAAAHYRQVDTYLQYASYITGVLGTSGSVGSRLAWNVLATKSPRLSAIFIASASVTALLLACVAWRFWLGELSNKGGRGQRNREEIGAGAT